MNLRIALFLNRLLAAIGVAVFATLFFYITAAPEDFDQRTRTIAISEIGSSVKDTLDKLAGSSAIDRVSTLAGRVSGNLSQQIQHTRQALDDGIDKLVGDILAATCKLDCDQREEARLRVRAFYEAKLVRYGAAADRLESLVIGKYDVVMSELRTDLRLFSASNTVAFALAFLLTLVRRNTARHLMPIIVALTGATMLMIVWYVFGQDWVMTIIFSDYWGWAYTVVLGIVFALMVDIAINGARITSAVFNAVSSVFGSILRLVPC